MDAGYDRVDRDDEVVPGPRPQQRRVVLQPERSLPGDRREVAGDELVLARARVGHRRRSARLAGTGGGCSTGLELPFPRLAGDLVEHGVDEPRLVLVVEPM